MGTWGTSLYSDDVAQDVRERYRQLVGETGSGTEATKEIRKEFAESLADPDEKTSVLLALADTQWRLGRLEPTTRRQALSIIERGADLQRWTEENPKLAEKRRLVLEALKDRLLREPPPPKKIAPSIQEAIPWNKGDVIAYQRRCGKFALFRVVGTFQEGSVTGPIIEVLARQGKRIPTEERIRQMEVRPDIHGHHASVLVFMSERGLRSKKFVATGVRTPTKYRPRRKEQVDTTIGAILGEKMDQCLEVFFGMR